MECQTAKKPLKFKPVPLDGGYGWVVVLGSFLIHVFTDGFVYSFGIIAERLIEEFEVPNSQVAIILSLLTGLMLATGPVASFLCEKIGCRLTTILGAIISIIGCFSSYYANSIVFLIFSVGVTMGTGFGFMYCAAIIIVTLYFERYRSLATGITVCGAGVGTLVFSLVIGKLLDEVGWRSVFIIYAVILLVCVPCGLLYRPVEMKAVYERETSADHKSDPLGRRSSLRAEIYVTKSQHSGIFFGDKIQPALTDVCEHAMGTEEEEETVGEDLPEVESNVPQIGAPASSDQKANEEAPSFLRIKGCADLSLLFDPLYIIFAISNFLGSIGFNAPPAFMPLHAAVTFHSGQANTVSAYGIGNIIGRIAFGFLCDRQLPFSWGRDCALNRLVIFITTLAICGVGTCMVYALGSLNLFLGFCFYFGFTISSFVCLWSVILVDLVGVDRLLNAFGMLLFIQGVATFVGPPIAGWFFDLTQSYGWTFGFCGISLFLSGAIMIVVPFIWGPRRRTLVRNGVLSKSDLID